MIVEGINPDKNEKNIKNTVNRNTKMNMAKAEFYENCFMKELFMKEINTALFFFNISQVILHKVAF